MNIFNRMNDLINPIDNKLMITEISEMLFKTNNSF